MSPALFATGPCLGSLDIAGEPVPHVKIEKGRVDFPKSPVNGDVIIRSARLRYETRMGRMVQPWRRGLT